MTLLRWYLAGRLLVAIRPSQLRGQRMSYSTVEHASHLSLWIEQARNNERDYR